MRKWNKAISLLMLFVLFTALSNTALVSSAATGKTEAGTEYPIQEMNLLTRGGMYLQQDPATGFSTSKATGSKNQNWQFIYVADNVFKIINSNNNKALTVNGSSVTLATDSNKESQYFTITSQSKDVLGGALAYKITTYKDASLALTITDGKTLEVKDYTGSNSQKWLLNSAGLQGFAGYSLDMDGKEKASTIGGALGKTVTVKTVAELERYAAGDTPTTIVIANDLYVNVHSSFKHLDSDEKLLTKVKVGKNKTIIGAYGVTLNNIYFYLDQYSKSGNVILKNVTIAHAEEYDLNNFIPLYISEGVNFWIDHVTFKGHESYSAKNGTIQDIHQKGLDENNHAVDKFVYVGVKADYVTISDSKFTNHEYGLILGYPNENSEAIMDTYTGYPRMTISGNYFTRLYCRAPGLMRYGNYHTLNNYVEDAHLAYTLYTRATVYSESNYFGNVKGILDDKVCNGFTDVGSYPVVKAKYSPESKWAPNSNYSYLAVNANEAKAFCTSYSGAQDSASNFKYLTDLFGTEVDGGSSDDAVADDDSTTEEDTSKDDETSKEETPSEEEAPTEKEEVPAQEAKEHNFTTAGKTSDFFAITGSLSKSKGTATYNGLTLSQCLKIESSTNVKFTTTSASTLTLVFNTGFNGQIVVDGTRYNAVNGVATVQLSAGIHTITKDDTCNLYYMQVA